MRRPLVPLALGLILMAATPAAFGGWATITVEELPEYLEVGTATTLAFTIRHHGESLMDDRSPTVIIGEKRGWLSRAPRVRAERRQGSAVYEATITAEETGALSITIDADFNRVQSTLLPIRVVTAGDRPAAMPAPERGRSLFVAKGCVTCHMKADDDFGERQIIRVGPDLGDRTFDADWLVQKLAQPAQFRSGNGYARMPNLRLDDAEIAALVSYLSGPARSASTR